MKKFKKKVDLAAKCVDCNYIEKVENAGTIVTHDGKEIQIMHNGVMIYKDCYHEFITEIISILKGHHEPQEEKAFYEILKRVGESGEMLELGANWSYYSLWFQKFIKNSTNYLIEPNPEKLESGKRNFQLNGFEGSFSQGFIGKKYSEKEVFVDWDNSEFEIPMYSIDSFLEQKKISKLDVLHADVQGAEYDMLIGAEDSLENCKIRYIFISTHSDQLHFDCLNFLKNKKYEIVVQHQVDESYSEDGLIVASSPKEEYKAIEVSKHIVRDNLLSRAINKVKSSFRPKFYSQYGQDNYLFHYFNKKKSGVFVEVGADDGVHNSNTFFFEKLGWQGLCIEPSPKRFSYLQENRNCICENYAIHTEEGEFSFLDISGWGKGLSGLKSSYNSQHVERISKEIQNPNNMGSEEIVVPTIPLTKLLLKHDFTYIDFMSIDIEGGELEAIKSIDFDRVAIKVLVIENNYGDQAVADHLEKYNYKLKSRIKIDDVFIRENI